MSTLTPSGQSPDQQELPLIQQGDSPAPETASSGLRGLLRYPGSGLFIFCCAALALGAIYAVLSLCGIDLYARLGLTKLRCGFHELTGFYCPGCGGTRSTLSLLKFRPLRSFLYHPLPLYVAALLVNFMVRFISAYLLPARVDRRLKPPRFRVAYVIIAAVLLAVNFLVRNLLLLAGIDTL